MPETAYTEFCNHSYQLTKDISAYMKDTVSPAIDRRCSDNPGADPRWYRVILYPYGRIAKWLITVEQLNKTSNLQGVGAGARAIFEHSLDLKWLQAFPGAEWFERFRVFADVDRYMTAKKFVDHKQSNIRSRLDTTMHEGLIRRMDASEPFAQKLLRVWGTNEKGKPRTRIDHWTGIGNLRERAKRIDDAMAIGPICEDMYVMIYPGLSALIHSGPSAEHGTFDWMESQAGFAYYFAFENAKSATEVICKILGISDLVPGFAAKMQQLEAWSEEALSKVPKVTQMP